MSIIWYNLGEGMQYRIIKTPEYQEWLENETKKSVVQIEDRISKIEAEGHFGTHKNLGNEVWELKWQNGRRIYFACIPEYRILLLLGGNKNGQDKDIQKSKKIFRKYVEIEA